MPKPSVVVVGSLNLDYIASVDRLPGAGQTVLAQGLVRRFGGKGANQAIAAARQGAQVSMIGCVGDGDDGLSYHARLASEKINTEAIGTTSNALTGTALIAVDRNAENLIIVASGANGELKPAHIRKHSALIRSAQVVLTQMEIPLRSLVETIRLANRAGVSTILNPSPLRDGFPWGQCELCVLVVNEGEARTIFGLEPDDAGKQLLRWRRGLQRYHIAHLLITRGASSTTRISQDEFDQVRTLRVKPVDTVGAGDAFAGALAARLAEGLDWLAAVRCANCAGALATLKRGAQESIPSRAATNRAVRQLV